MFKNTQLIGFGCGSHDSHSGGGGGGPGGSGIVSMTYTDGERQSMLNTNSIAHTGLDFGTENADRWIVVVAIGFGDGSTAASPIIYINFDEGGTTTKCLDVTTSNGQHEIIMGYKKVPTDRASGNYVSLFYDQEKTDSCIGVYSVIVDSGATLTPLGLAEGAQNAAWTDAQTGNVAITNGGFIVGALYGRHDTLEKPQITASGETFIRDFDYKNPLYGNQYAIISSESSVTASGTPLEVTFDEAMYIFGARGFYAT